MVIVGVCWLFWFGYGVGVWWQVVEVVVVIGIGYGVVVDWIVDQVGVGQGDDDVGQVGFIWIDDVIVVVVDLDFVVDFVVEWNFVKQVVY